MAREAPRAVLFRRGPSKQVRLILWHTDTDQFERGQWLKGRIREQRSDLSPDGKLLVYLADRHRSSDGDHWTAISRPPYLTALAAWKSPDGWDSGGGVFETPRSIRLAVPAGSPMLAGTCPDSPSLAFVANETDPDQYPNRDRWRTQHGWTKHNLDGPAIRQLLKDDRIADPHSTYRHMFVELSDEELLIDRWPRPPEIWSKQGAGANVELLVEFSAYHLNLHFRMVPHDGRLQSCRADWADIDQAGRAVFARDGCVFSLTVGPDGSPTERLLADFNGDRFEPIEAPEWATRW